LLQKGNWKEPISLHSELCSQGRNQRRG